MNTFQDLEHALLTGIVLGTLKKSGLQVDGIVNAVDDPTPYLKITIDRIEAVIVVLPAE
jgi:hypothetical protein